MVSSRFCFKKNEFLLKNNLADKIKKINLPPKIVESNFKISINTKRLLI